MNAAIAALRSRTPRRPTWSETASIVIPAVFAVAMAYTEVAARHADVLAYDFWRNVWSFDRDVGGAAVLTGAHFCGPTGSAPSGVDRRRSLRARSRRSSVAWSRSG